MGWFSATCRALTKAPRVWFIRIFKSYVMSSPTWQIAMVYRGCLLYERKVFFWDDIFGSPEPVLVVHFPSSGNAFPTPVFWGHQPIRVETYLLLEVVWQCIIFIYIYIMLDADESWDFQLSWLLTWEDGNGTSRDWHFPKGEDLLQIFAGCWVVMRGVAPIIWDSRTFEDPDNRPYFWNIYIYKY